MTTIFGAIMLVTFVAIVIAVLSDAIGFIKEIWTEE